MDVENPEPVIYSSEVLLPLKNSILIQVSASWKLFWRDWLAEQSLCPLQLISALRTDCVNISFTVVTRTYILIIK